VGGHFAHRTQSSPVMHERVGGVASGSQQRLAVGPLLQTSGRLSGCVIVVVGGGAEEQVAECFVEHLQHQHFEQQRVLCTAPSASDSLKGLRPTWAVLAQAFTVSLCQ
jgi:hypothetical protein